MNPSSIGMLRRASIPAVMFCSENTVVRTELTCTTLMAASCLRSTGSSSTLARFPAAQGQRLVGSEVCVTELFEHQQRGDLADMSSLNEIGNS